MKMCGGRDHTNIPKTPRKDNREKSSARKVDETRERIKRDTKIEESPQTSPCTFFLFANLEIPWVLFGFLPVSLPSFPYSLNVRRYDHWNIT
jgi:hypothetical protein